MTLFHLAVWVSSAFDSIEECAQDLAPQTSNTWLLFHSPEAIQRYRDWLRDYKAICFPNTDNLSDIAIPFVKPGSINGHFVRFENAELDSIGYSIYGQCVLGISAYKTIFLTAALPSWAWIAKNCHSQVRCMPGGWLFDDQTEAVNFKLSEPTFDQNPILIALGYSA